MLLSSFYRQFALLFLQETAKSKAELLVKALDDKEQGVLPHLRIKCFNNRNIKWSSFFQTCFQLNQN